MKCLFLLSLFFFSQAWGSLIPNPCENFYKSSLLLGKVNKIYSKDKLPASNLYQDKKFEPGKQYTAETLATKIFAVHVTQFLPEEGVLRAAGNPIPRFLPTIHFSLGEVVRPHQLGNWESMPYAIITPLKSLEPQLLNLMAYDTFILGDFKLPPEAVLLLPKESVHLAPEGLKVVTYDRNTTTLRQAVDLLIKNKGGWPLRGLNNAGTMIHPVTINGWNINTSQFFAPLLARNPGASFGQHVVSESKKGARFGALDEWSRYRFAALSKGKELQISSHKLSFEISLAIRHLNAIEREIETQNFPTVSKQSFYQARNRLLAWINLAKLELMLRKNYGKTFFEISDYKSDQKLKYINLRDNPKSLFALAESDIQNLPVFKEPKEFSGPDSDAQWLASHLQHVPWAEKERILKQFPKWVNQSGKERIDLYYSLNRTLNLTFEDAKKENLFKKIEQATSILLRTENESQLESLTSRIKKILAISLNQESKRVKNSLSLLRLPSVQTLLENHFKIKFSNPKLLNLQDYLRANPATANSFEPLPQLPTDLTVLALFMAFKMIPKPMALPPFKSYAEARVTAEAIDHNIQIIASIKDLEQKPADVILTSNYYDPNQSLLGHLKLMGDSKLENFWKDLNLWKNFRTRFAKNEDFWKSDIPLIEIFRQLSDENLGKETLSNLE